jgi:Ca-activated chloride channel homolog
MQLEFARPEFLYLLLGLPIWALLMWPRAGRGILFARGESARRLGRFWGAPAFVAMLLPRLLRAGALAGLVIALAQPESVHIVQDRELRGKAIGLVVDLSSSMLAEDMEDGATRIDVARNAATRFAEGRTLDELSLIAFSGRAVTRVPPTTDPDVIVAGVESLEIQLVGDGTDISAGLLTAVHRMLESEREPRVVVLLTDGAHNGSGVRPLTAARAAASLGVKVHAISILGPEDPANSATLQAAYRSAEATGGGGDMQTVLSGIAAITGGQYFHASTGAALDSIYREINRLEAPEVDVTDREVRNPEKIWFLMAALALVGLEMLLRGSRMGIIP